VLLQDPGQRRDEGSWKDVDPVAIESEAASGRRKVQKNGTVNHTAVIQDGTFQTIEKKARAFKATITD